MLSYIPQGYFRRKDFLASGNPDKLIVAAELAAEFDAIQRAINSHPSGSYTVATAFRPKDSLASGQALKIVSGLELDAEFDAIATAIAALGGSYTKTYNFTTFHNTDEEILGLYFETEFRAISVAVETVRATRDTEDGAFIVTEDAEWSYIETEDDTDTLLVTE